MKLKVLFLCENNAVQSPMAEALLRASDTEHFEVASAGVEPNNINPLTVEVMKEVGVDLQTKVTTPVRDVLQGQFDFVITLCDRARTECPQFAQAETVHWQLDNPFSAHDPTRQRRMFQSLRDQIAQRVRLFALVQSRFIGIDTSDHNRANQGDLVSS